MSVPCCFPLLSLPFITAWPLVTLAVVHPCGPLRTNAGGKVAGGGGVLVGLELREPACVCDLCCCFVQDLGVCRNC